MINFDVAKALNIIIIKRTYTKIRIEGSRKRNLNTVRLFERFALAKKAEN